MKRNIVFLVGMFLIFMACGDEGPSTSSCETADLTYSDVSSIFNTNCATSGCHVEGGQSPEMFSYDKIKEEIDGPNRILGSINHDDGFRPMPYPEGSDKLSDCNIDKIEAWIADGAPE